MYQWKWLIWISEGTSPSQRLHFVIILPLPVNNNPTLVSLLIHVSADKFSPQNLIDSVYGFPRFIKLCWTVTSGKNVQCKVSFMAGTWSPRYTWIVEPCSWLKNNVRDYRHKTTQVLVLPSLKGIALEMSVCRLFPRCAGPSINPYRFTDVPSHGC